MLRKYHIQFFFLFLAVENMAANFAHPITPTLIQQLQLPDYSFGVIYAGMAFTNFLFSPFWARMVQRIGSRCVLGICCIGYGVGQFLFSIMTTLPSIMIARFTSGFFVGGIMVSYLTYILHKADMEKRGSWLALSATFTTVFAAFGYLIGGLSGVISIPLTFAIQSLTLMFSGVMFFFTLEDDRQKQSERFALRDANPFQAFLDSKCFMTLTFFILFFVVFLASAATTAYDQNFNYYLKDQFQFPSSYNGLLKALVGFISLAANMTVCVWLMKKTDVKNSILPVLAGAGGLLLLMVCMPSVLAFLAVNLVFFGFNAVYVPLLQDMCASASTKENGNMVMGFYNAMKSLGMIAGALFAGFLYAFGAKLSFLCAGLFFLLCMLLMLWYRCRMKKGSA